MKKIIRHLLIPLLVLYLPLQAKAALVEFSSTCNNDAPFVSSSTGNCALFGLSDTDRVTGFFTYSDVFFTPGSGISLQNDQYDFFFEFGNQTFTEQDSALDLSFIVSNSGISITSIAGLFVNANGAQLNLLTPSVVRILLASEGADTFGEGSSWLVSGSSVVPLPAAIWLFGTALIGFVGISRKRKIA